MPARLSDEQGVALPMALMTLALLTSLMLAFAALSETEPIIAANHLRGSQARTLAESGVEYALWALSNATHPAGLPAALPGVAAAPFDGSTFIALGDTGGFTIRVANDAGGDPQRRTLRAVGWTPTNSAADARPKGRRTVSVDVVAVPDLGARAPCALCVRGALAIAGNVAIDGSNRDPACGDDTKYGTFTRDATTVTGPVTVAGGAGARAQHQSAGAFEAVTLSPAALDALKTMAWRNGTYYGPGFPRGGTLSDGQATWDGRIAFGASNPLPDGIVFIDTTDGSNLAAGAGGGATLAGARLEAGAFAGRDGVFHGWLVVNGSVEFTAGLSVSGLVYAVDSLTYQAAGAGRIEGLAVALNVSETSASKVEATGSGELALTFDCGRAAGTGLVPHVFVPIPGTYREDSD
jgi:hypothetical protein